MKCASGPEATAGARPFGKACGCSAGLSFIIVAIVVPVLSRERSGVDSAIFQVEKGTLDTKQSGSSV